MGRPADRCDSSCHDAQGPRCSCWCGGRYHGLGSLEVRWRVWKDHGGLAEELVRSGVGLANPYASGPLFAALERDAQRGRLIAALRARRWPRRRRAVPTGGPDGHR